AATKQIKEQFDPDGDSALVLAGRGWHVGVIGLVAGRLAEKYHRPVALIALDQLGVKPGIGSARSPNGLNLHTALAACSEPVLCATGVRLAEPPKRIGASERHISLKLLQQRTAIRGVGFGCAEWADELAAVSAPLDIAYKPVINDYRGRQNVEIQLVDWRLS